MRTYPITEFEKTRMRYHYSRGLSISKIAIMFGRPYKTASNICRTAQRKEVSRDG
jgi:transposase